MRMQVALNNPSLPAEDQAPLDLTQTAMISLVVAPAFGASLVPMAMHLSPWPATLMIGGVAVCIASSDTPLSQLAKPKLPLLATWSLDTPRALARRPALKFDGTGPHCPLGLQLASTDGAGDELGDEDDEQAVTLPKAAASIAAPIIPRTIMVHAPSMGGKRQAKNNIILYFLQ